MTNAWDDYQNVKEQFIQSIAKNMKLYGITPSVGRLFGILYFSDEPMTLDDMRSELGMSKTSMSTGVRALLDMKMVEPVFRRGVRKDLYQTEDDWYKSFAALFSSQWKKATQTNIEEMTEAKEKLEEMAAATEDEDLVHKIKGDLERLEYAKGYYEWLLRFVTVIETGEIFQYVPKHPDEKRR
ncbi:MAG TPA: GbsR/MarR family transcriptional regulator [Bacillales bacterium]|nr:GbsR/MarR family transcriptional regulator [Bacillales bacterium]